MAEMSVPTTSIQFFPKSALCSLSTRKFNPHDLWVSSAIVSPSPRFCLKSKYNSLPFCAAAVKAASSSEKTQTEPMIPPYNVLITGGSKGQWFAAQNFQNTAIEMGFVIICHVTLNFCFSVFFLRQTIVLKFADC